MKLEQNKDCFPIPSFCPYPFKRQTQEVWSCTGGASEQGPTKELSEGSEYTLSLPFVGWESQETKHIKAGIKKVLLSFCGSETEAERTHQGTFSRADHLSGIKHRLENPSDLTYFPRIKQEKCKHSPSLTLARSFTCETSLLFKMRSISLLKLIPAGCCLTWSTLFELQPSKYVLLLMAILVVP